MDFFNSQEFGERVDKLLEEWHCPGVGIAVTHNGKTASRGFGKASEGKAVTGDTAFDIASCSKSLTCGAVALLVADEEKYPHVQWNTVVSKLMPEDFVLWSKEYTDNVTIEDILSHRTGIPRHDMSSLSPRAENPDTPQSITRNLRNLEPTAPLRTKFMYNNLMLTAAAYLVEVLSGMSFLDFVKERIFDPLGMKTSTIHPKNALAAGFDVAQPYRWEKKTSTFHEVERQDSPEAVGAGLVVTSPNDYAKWVQAIMLQEGPITDDVQKALTTPRTIIIDDEELPPFTSTHLYCLGLETHNYRGYEVIHHTGGDPGVATNHFFIPSAKFGAVVFTNAGTGYCVHTVISRELIDAALSVPKDQLIDWNKREREIDDRENEEEKENKEKKRKELCPEYDGTPEPQPGSLERYTGRYHNVGYHSFDVVINEDGKLSLDISDRTMGWKLVLEHICGGTKYIGHELDYYGENDDEAETVAEFVFEGEKVLRLGLDLEDELESRRIWFDRLEDTKTLPQR